MGHTPQCERAFLTIIYQKICTIIFIIAKPRKNTKFPSTECSHCVILTHGILHSREKLMTYIYTINDSYITLIETSKIIPIMVFYSKTTESIQYIDKEYIHF